MYWKVPRIVPCAVRFGGVVGSIERLPATAGAPVFARPKSSSFAPALRQHDVARLEIAMDDAGAMGCGECVGDLNPNLQRLVERQRTFLQSLFQRLAFQVLHDQEVDPVLATDVVTRDRCADDSGPRASWPRARTAASGQGLRRRARGGL